MIGLISYFIHSLFQHLRDFPLYTEAIKFFNHNESMVRIAVRTLTLNVYQVGAHQVLTLIKGTCSGAFSVSLLIDVTANKTLFYY